MTVNRWSSSLVEVVWDGSGPPDPIAMDADQAPAGAEVQIVDPIGVRHKMGELAY